MDDLISRQDAVDALYNADFQIYDGDWAVGRRNYMTKEEACAIIYGLPSAQRKGKWIPGKELSREFIGTVVVHVEYEKFTCSSCGFAVEDLLYHVDGSPFYKFCPNCGAEMEKEKE